MEPQHKPNKNIGIIIGAIVVLAIIAVIVFAEKKPAAPATDQSQPISSTTPAAPAAPSVSAPADTTKPSASTYKNGTYTATGSYMSPGGPDHVGVSVTLSDDVVTSLTFTPEPGDNTSAHYQDLFASGINALVVGKNLDAVAVKKVSGSSLTSRGFNDALSQIKAKARA